MLHIGRIRSDMNKPHSIWIISKKEEMLFLINNINGLIRLKVVGLKKSCDYLGIAYKEANYNIEANDPYLAGLVDTDGTIVYNYAGNRM
jgi:predicted RNA-binding protein